MIGLSGIIFNLSAAAVMALSPQFPTSYRIEVKLDTTDNSISGNERIEFLNPTADTLDQICFHLYPNAFKDTSSVFCRENSGIRAAVASGNRSQLDVSDLHIDDLRIDSSSINLSGTLLYAKLPAKLPPRQAISIALKFKLKIPRVIMRFGFNGRGNYLLAHWHPILCGYQDNELQDFEYHANSEFFSNFSSYNVKLDIPADFAVGATGELTQVSEDSSRAIWWAHADTVIDFAFACGPAFDVTETDTMGIHLRYMLEKRHSKYLSSVEDITTYSLLYNTGKFYEYPYKSFTLVDFQSGAQGMELPGLTVIGFPGIPNFPVGRAILNMAIAHEITHEWFYAIVATNEAKEPWLDEGMASYITDRIMSSRGDSLREISILGYKLNLSVLERLSAMMLKAEYPIDLRSWDYPGETSYDVAVYYRSALVFKTLEELLGRAKMDSSLSIYARDYRFRSPDGNDFERAVEISAGLDLDHFYEQFIRGTARVDYGIGSLEYKAVASEDSAKKYEVKVTVERRLDGILPETLSLALDDGLRLDTLWGGEERTAIFTFQTTSIPKYASLEPVYALDENIANNTFHRKSLGSRLLSFEWDMVFIKEFMLSLFL
jgi:hypothetical protein